MSKLILIDRKLRTVGGKLVTDAGGAPCCCGGSQDGADGCCDVGTGNCGFRFKDGTSDTDNRAIQTGTLTTTGFDVSADGELTSNLDGVFDFGAAKDGVSACTAGAGRDGILEKFQQGLGRTTYVRASHGGNLNFILDRVLSSGDNFIGVWGLVRVMANITTTVSPGGGEALDIRYANTSSQDYTFSGTISGTATRVDGVNACCRAIRVEASGSWTWNDHTSQSNGAGSFDLDTTLEFPGVAACPGNRPEPPQDPRIAATLDQQARGGGCAGCGEGFTG